MELLVICFLILLNGVFAMYEMALVSCSRARLETLSQKGNNTAKKVISLLAEPEKILSTIQVGITLTGIISGAYGGIALSGDLANFLKTIDSVREIANDLAVVIVVSLITYFSLVIGELVPKSLALNNPEKITISLTPLMVFLTKIVYPFVLLLSFSTKLFNKLFGIKENEDKSMTEEELKFILNQSSEQGVIDKEETQMIKDVFRFGDRRANEIMTHRSEVVIMEPTMTQNEVIVLIQEEKYSKYLLCEDNIDNIIGVIAVKGIISLLNEEAIFDLKSIAQEPLYIPENLKAAKVLELFKQKATNFGVVINEYGTVEGIITLHDITEAVLGEIPEENEMDEVDIVYREDGSMLVDGSMNIDDFMDKMEILVHEDIDNLGFTTLGGLAMHFLHRIPEEGDIFYYKELKFEVVDMDKSRVDKLLIMKIETTD
jgi:Hemolysins and related proteins containing CBS domains